MVSKSWFCSICGNICEFRQTIRQTGVFAKNLTRCPSNSGGVEAKWFDTKEKAKKDFDTWCSKTYCGDELCK